MIALSKSKLIPALVALLPCACNPTQADPDGDGGSAAPTTDAPTTDPPTTDPSPPDDPTTDSPTTGPAFECGNAVIEAGEECDGPELAGKQCADLDPAYTGGALACGGSCTLDASACTLAPDVAKVVLNELTSKPVPSGMYAGPGDAIELHNVGKQPADLSGWKLSDDPTFPPERTYVFPPGSALAPGEFRVLVALDEETLAGDYPFGISDNLVETITLVDAADGIVDSVVVDGYKAAVSYCRVPDGLGPWAQCEQTFGAANELAATACGNGELEDAEQCDGSVGGDTCQSLGLGYDGGALACTGKCTFDVSACTTTSTLVINELESTADQIELFNAGGPIDLSGYALTDEAVGPGYDPALDAMALVFPKGTMLGKSAYLVVSQGMEPGQHPFGLAAKGDRVTLIKPDKTIADQVTYGDQQAAISYCRQPNGPGGAWTADCVPTLGAEN